MALSGLRLGEQGQDQDVRARGGQARGHGRVQLPPVWQILSVTKVSEESQIYYAQKLCPTAILKSNVANYICAVVIMDKYFKVKYIYRN